MKSQRSRFRLISLLLVCAFLITVLLCAWRADLISFPVPNDRQAGNQPAPEESQNQPDIIPEENSPEPEPSPMYEPPYDTTGL